MSDLKCRWERKSFAKISSVMDVPNLIEIQKGSYERFLQYEKEPDKRGDIGLQSVFNSVFPIYDLKKISSLEFVKYSFGKPKYDIVECRERGVTFAAPLKVLVRLVVGEKDRDQETRSVKDVKEQEIYLGDIPLMTDQGTFIVNGTERTVVSQMHRSPGVFFGKEVVKDQIGRVTFMSRIIPYRGSWVEFEVGHDETVQMRIDRRRKLPATLLLRAVGLEKDIDILKEFYPIEEVEITGNRLCSTLDPDIHIGMKVAEDICDRDGQVVVKALHKISRGTFRKIKKAELSSFEVGISYLQGRFTAGDVIDEDSGEILVEANYELDEANIALILKAGISKLSLLGTSGVQGTVIIKTIACDSVKTRDQAVIEIYKRMRPGDPPTVDNARKLFDEMFFNPKRYDLSGVGRLKLNCKLGMPRKKSDRVLDKTDFIEIIRYLVNLVNGKGELDDIDNLGNRRVRSVGELLENQFRIGLIRMERAIKERMSIQDMTDVMPYELINAKPVTAVVKEFFGSSQLSQFMDQTNPLAELTHKRRLSALGPGGLSRERAGFEARDVHPTHYGRICPIETPEGPNIGLIASLSTYAKTNEYGFIETPYRVVKEGVVQREIVYLSAMDETRVVIAQANSVLNGDGTFASQRISSRKGEDFVIVTSDRVDYMDVSPKQLVSVSASLIPFLEHDDANRALMGSNMQRQSVPLLRTDAPFVGTGMESIVARDSGAVVLARRAGVVGSVSADRIIVYADEYDPNDGEDVGVDVYHLSKFTRSNQNTCINQKPLVSRDEPVKKGDVLADGPATQGGDLALGHNILVAFMPWCGYNYEDAILISEKVVKEDRYTSIHIEQFEVEARDTKLGREEITRDIPNLGEDALNNLDESGIIRIGAEVKPGDVLVGRVTPKGETQLTPEEKLLRAIFGEKAGDVRDVSLMVPPGIEGVVVDVRVFARKGCDKDQRTASIEDEQRRKVESARDDEVKVVMTYGFEEVRRALVGQKVASDVCDEKDGSLLVSKNNEFTPGAARKVSDGLLLHGDLSLNDKKVDALLAQTRDQVKNRIKKIKSKYQEKLDKLGKGGELSPGVIKLVKVYVAMKRKLSVGDKMAGRHGNKGVVSRILPEQDMPYLPDGTPVEIVLNPLGVPSRMNVGQILETHLGWAAKALGLHYAVPVFDGALESEIKDELKKAGLDSSGQSILYDGRTGLQIGQKVTVGYIYMLKLAHLVDDKIHARSIGPYSLVTQQPLGGKAQFGGQRFGEMEVWALESYGAAYTLQEILTVKSDDVQGRTRAYEAIVKGEEINVSGIPESFNVLLKELQSLCLDVRLLEA